MECYWARWPLTPSLCPFLCSFCPPSSRLCPQFADLAERAVVPCRARAYLCSTSCCQAAGEAKKQNLQAPHGECLPLGSLLTSSPVFMELGPRSCVCIPCIHRHTGVGWSIFSQVRLALSTRSGAHGAPVWVTAHLGAEAGGMDVMKCLPGPTLAVC